MLAARRRSPLTSESILQYLNAVDRPNSRTILTKLCIDADFEVSGEGRNEYDFDQEDGASNRATVA